MISPAMVQPEHISKISTLLHRVFDVQMTFLTSCGGHAVLRSQSKPLDLLWHPEHSYKHWETCYEEVVAKNGWQTCSSACLELPLFVDRSISVWTRSKPMFTEFRKSDFLDAWAGAKVFGLGAGSTFRCLSRILMHFFILLIIYIYICIIHLFAGLLHLLIATLKFECWCIPQRQGTALEIVELGGVCAVQLSRTLP